MLTRLREKKGDKDGAAERFAGIGVVTAISRNAAHLGEILASQEVEKMEELKEDMETLGGEARRKGKGARSSQSSRRQWRWRFRRLSREREGGREWTGAGECGVSWRR